MENLYDTIIVGSGPAGLTAGIYTTRASLKTLILAGEKWGGQLQLTSVIENFPGFPDGIEGPKLMQRMKDQAKKHGAEILDENVKEADFSKNPFQVTVGEATYFAKTVIIATGADTRWLGVKGEAGLIGRGVSSCATCDAPFFRGKNVIIVGGGDSAMEEALVLAKVATSVTIVHRREEFRASSIMLTRVKENLKISFMLNSQIVEILGEGRVQNVKIKNNQTGNVSEKSIDGVFVAIGHIPNSNVFKGIDVDKEGYVLVSDHYKTNVPGVFVAGDVHDRDYRQAVTAAGYGASAALEVEKWLTTNKPTHIVPSES